MSRRFTDGTSRVDEAPSGIQRRFPLERFHESTDVRIDLDLVERQRVDIIRVQPLRSEVIADHARTSRVAMRREFREKVTEMKRAKK